MIYNKNCGNKGPWPPVKKIPSLLEIEVPIPPQLLASNPELRREEEKSMMRHSSMKSEVEGIEIKHVSRDHVEIESIEVWIMQK